MISWIPAGWTRAIPLSNIWTREEANNDEEVDRIMTLEEEMIVRYDSGLQKGRAEGATLKQREIAQNLKNAGIPIPVIAETTGLTQEEVEML